MMLRHVIPGVLLWCFLPFTACQVQPLNDPVPVEVPDRWDQAPETTTTWPAPDWWRNFGSAELDQLMIEAENNNPDLAAAAARILQAEAQARLAGVALLPAVDFGAGASRQGSFGGENPVDATNSFNISVGASYEIDFWGKNRAGLLSAQESLLASQSDRETVALTMTSAVAITYLQVLSLRERTAIARLNLENAEDVLKLVAARVKYGAVSPLDLAQQRTVVARQRAAIPPLVQQERDARSALALLLGRPPQSFDVAAKTLDEITIPEVAAGLPSELLTRRPDIQTAEAQLRAANADIAAARAAYFPSIGLTGSAGLASTALSGLLDSGLLYTLAVSLAQPIFDAGQREAQEDLAVARREELVQVYRASIINAFADVDTALGTIRSTAEQQDHQAEQIRQAEIALRLAERRYKEGAENLLTVLAAQRTLYDTQDELQQTMFAHLQAIVGLYRTLGGGWERETYARL
ncbi:MAG: efflux transporter outer membrane subunit [Gammaproteobacteria bacterium]